MKITKIKIKGADVYETLENLSFLAMGVGILLVIVGFTLSVGSSNQVAGSAAIFGSFIFFAFLVALILSMLLKEMKGSTAQKEAKPE